MQEQLAPQKRRLTRKQIGQLLRDHGYPIGDGTLDRICSPAQAKGPPVDCWWNGRPLYDPDIVLAWAEARISDQPQSFTRDGSQRPTRRSAAAQAERGDA
jgi:hypothetical protein